jgi:hypothetical protein
MVLTLGIGLILALIGLIMQRVHIGDLDKQLAGLRRAFIGQEKLKQKLEDRLSRQDHDELGRSLRHTRANEKNAHIGGQFLRKQP